MADLTPNATPPPDDIFGTKAGPKPCKSEHADGSAGVSPLNPSCPQCKSKKLWRDGNTTLFGQKIQRWLCRDCGYRFSDKNDLQKAKTAVETVPTVDTKPLKSQPDIVETSQICVTETKNLEAEPQTNEVLWRNENQTGGFKHKIEEYGNWLRNNGKSQATIRGRVKLLKRLTRRGANLYEPESMKKTIADQTWGNGQKNNAVDAYSSFLKMVGGIWELPLYKIVRKIPFIPKEVEIDQLIAACSPRMATFLQLLKETGARCGEIWQLTWSDIDFESKIVNITPEKNSNPRVAHLSNKLLDMLQSLPKRYGDRVFSLITMLIDNFAVNFQRQRRRAAHKLKNPRLLKIHFHTLRYWKGTMLYHQTKDMYYVMQRLGHKNIKNTLLYVNSKKRSSKAKTNTSQKLLKQKKTFANS